jgi:hypothetical protein
MTRWILILVSVAGFSATIFGQEVKPPDKPIPIIELPPLEKPVNIAKYDAVKISEALPWHVTLNKAPEAWAKNPLAKGKKIRVAVLDTGGQKDHPYYAKQVIATYNAITKTTNADDQNNHGTHCLGGVSSVVPEAELIVVKVLNDQGSGKVSDIAHGIDWAVTVGRADVISLSLGGNSPDEWIPPALDLATKAGVIVIAAAGNAGPGDTEGYPGRYKESISIAAADKNYKLAGFSSWGPNVFTTDYGVNITGPLPGNRMGDMSGTSMATPLAAGKAASWVATHPDVPKQDRPAEFRKAVIAASPFKERKNSIGYGLYTLDKITPAGTPPISPTPGKPVSIVIELKDLSPEKQAELKAGGATKFRVEFGHETTAPAPLPSVTRLGSLGYPAAVAAVARGEQITLAIGVPAPSGAYHTDSVQGVAPGVYDCRLEGGRPLMRLRSSVQQWLAPAPAPLPSCGPGGCPQPAWGVPGFRFR